MKKITHIVMCVLLVLFASKTRAQISGVVTVPGNYPSIAAVINTLNTGGVSGAVTVNIAAGYTETAPNGGYVLNAIAGASAANQITFQKSGAGANPLITASTSGFNTPSSIVQDGVWNFVGTDWVTVDGINITDPNTVNPMTMEYGFGFFKASGNDGCQNNTIKNSVITLSRVNNASGTAPAIEGSRGINVVNSLMTSQTTALTVFSAAGSNSNNKFYANVIQNCNVGVSLYGYGFSSSAPTLGDAGNDIGGASAATSNTIINFGGGGSTQSEGVYAINQSTLNVSNNIINSNNGSGLNSAGAVRGVYVGATALPFYSINNNTITLRSNGTTANMSGIEILSGGTAANNAVNVNGNLFANCVFGSTGGGSFNGILNAALAASVSISNNTYSNNIIGGTSASGGFINNTASATSVININNNVGTSSSLTWTNVTSNSFNFIYSNAAATTATLNINNNNIQGITYGGAVSSGAPVFIFNGATPQWLNINGNTFTNLNLNTTGSVTFINNDLAFPANGIVSVSNNSIVTGFSKTGAGGTIILYNASTSPSSPSSVTKTYANNNFSNMTFTGATTMSGWIDNEGAPGPTKIFSNNVFTNWIGGSSGITGMATNWSGAGSSFIGNLFSNVTGTGAITGITWSSSNSGSLQTIANNTISSLSGGGAITGFNITSASTTSLNVMNNTINGFTTTGSSAVSGISSALSSSVNISKNKIFDLQTAGTVNGLLVSSGTNTISNNMIGDLRAPAVSAANPVNGINISGGTLMNLYFNSVYLNASSTGAIFGSSALNVSTSPNVNLVNNIFYNSSTPNSTGVVAAYRRSSTTLTTHGAISNNNLYYAGTPSGNGLVTGNRAILYDGTNTYLTLADFKNLLVNRDQASVSENVSFLSTAGSNANFLKANTTIPTLIESGGIPAGGITDDFYGTTRNVTTPDIGAIESTYSVYATCSGTPQAATALTSSSLVCPASPIVVGLPATYTNTGLSFQWQQSPASAAGPFFAVPGATTTAYSTNAGYANVWYRAVITCATASVASSPVLVAIGPAVSPTAVATSSAICAGSSAALTLTNATGPLGLGYQWQVSTTGAAGPYSPISGATLTTLTSTNVTVNTFYQAIVSCSASPNFSVASVPAGVNANSLAITPVAATNNSVVCPNVSVNLSLTGNTGSGLVYQWMASTTGSNTGFTSVPGATTSAYSPTASATTWYQAVVSCSASGSNSVSSTPVQVTAGLPTATLITASAATTLLCPNLSSALSLSGNTGSGLAYQWQAATTGSAGPYSAVAGATTAAYSATVASSTFYQAVVSCSANSSFSMTSTSVLVSTNSTVTPTAIAASSTICPNSTSALSLTTTAAPASGLSYQWLASTTGSNGAYSAVTNATVVPYTATVGATTWYQAVVSCTANPTATLLSTPVLVTTGNPSVSPVTSVSNPNICNGAVAALSLVNNSAPANVLYQWQSASSAAGPYSAIPSATNTTYNATVTTSTWYQAVESCSTNSTFSVASAPVLINVSAPLLNVVTTAASTTVCTNVTSALSLSNNSGFTGIVYQWQVSTSGASGPYSAIATATTSGYTPTITTTSWYQAVISCSANPSASVASSPVMVVAGLPAMTPSAAVASTLLCSGLTDVLSLNGVSGSGVGYQWLSSSTGAPGSYATIANATVTPYTATVSGNTFYQAVVSCSATASFSVASTTVSVIASSPASATAAASSTLLCPGLTTNLTLTGASGSGLIYQWQASTTSSTGAYSAISNATTSAYTNTVSNTAWYQAVISCSASTSSSILSTPVLVTAGVPVTSTVATISSSSVLCTGNSVNLSLSPSAGSGVSYQWLSSTTSSTSGFASVSNATLSTLTSTNAPLGSNWFEAVISCSAAPTLSVVSAPAAITASAGPTASITAASSVACIGSSLTLNGSTDIGTVFIWKGPSSYTSNAQNATVPAIAGVYTLVTTLSTCSSVPSTYAISTIGDFSSYSGGAVSASTNSVCAGAGTSSTLQVTPFLSSAKTYSFSSSNGAALVSLTAGSVQLIASGDDDTPNTPQVMGMTFNFNGVDYVNYAVSPDGWLEFGLATFVTTPGNQFTNDLTSGTNVPKIAPYWDDQSTGSNGYVRSQLFGTAPTRSLVVEWFTPLNRTSSYATQTANATYQAILYETTNVIEFRYSAMTSDIVGGSSCGIEGASGNAISVTYTNNSASSTAVNNSNFTQPNPGTSYVFTPTFPSVTYTWAPGVTLSSTSAATTIATPVTSTIYSLNTTYQGCVASKTLAVNVIQSPTVNITMSSPTSTLCPGTTATLTASGANTYSWSNNTTNTAIVVLAPSSPVIYSVTGTNGTCGSSTKTVAVSQSTSALNISGSSGICTGQTATLVASGVSTYTWSTGANTATITDAPTTNGTFTYGVVGTDAAGCLLGANQVLNVATGLSITITSPSVSCSGQTFSLVAGGGVTYTWSVGNATTASIVDAPTTTTTYSLVGASGTCSNSAVKTITVNANPTLTVSASSTVCAGTTLTLTSIGATTYSWNTSSTATSVVVSPTNTTIYTVVGTNTAFCTDTKSVTVTTNTLPIIAVALSTNSVCAGTAITFSATGANTFTWTGGPTTFTNVVSPTVTTVYTVTGTNAALCVSSTTVSPVTYSLPIVVVSPASPTICSTSTLLLTSSGANTYTWTGGPTTNTRVVNPATTTTYSVIGTNTLTGCVSTKTMVVTTNTLPVVVIAQSASSVCVSAILTLTNSGAATYSLNGSGVSPITAVYPTANTTYTVTGASPQGCTSTNTVAVSSLSLPVLAVTPALSTVCVNSTSNYTASGAVTFTWNGSANGSVTAITTTAAPFGAYNVTGTGLNGCVGSAQFVVVTNPLPVVSIAASNGTICSLSPVSFSATGADTYNWSNSATGGVVTVSPANGSTYTVTGTYSLTGCSSQQTVAVSTTSLPAVVISPASPSVCAKSLLTLTGSGASSYQWSNGSINTSINVTTPSVTGTPSVVTYVLVGTDAIGCTNSQTVQVTVNPLPVIAASSKTMCISEGVATFTASGASTYTWLPNNAIGSTFTVAPGISATYNYTVTGTDANGCVNKTFILLEVDDCVGIKTNSFSSNVVKLFPNPSTGMFTASFDFAGEKTITIVNSVGQLISQTVSTNTSEVFNLSEMAKGVYFVKVSTKESTGNYKIIIE